MTCLRQRANNTPGAPFNQSVADEFCLVVCACSGAHQLALDRLSFRPTRAKRACRLFGERPAFEDAEPSVSPGGFTDHDQQTIPFTTSELFETKPALNMASTSRACVVFIPRLLARNEGTVRVVAGACEAHATARR